MRGLGLLSGFDSPNHPSQESQRHRAHSFETGQLLPGRLFFKDFPSSHCSTACVNHSVTPGGIHPGSPGESPLQWWLGVHGPMQLTQKVLRPFTTYSCPSGEFVQRHTCPLLISSLEASVPGHSIAPVCPYRRPGIITKVLSSGIPARIWERREAAGRPPAGSCRVASFPLV